MGSLADMLLAFLDLMEAEAKVLRAGVTQMVFVLLLLLIFAVLCLAGLGLLIWSLYLYLRLAAAPPLSALLAGLISLVVAGVLAWSAKKLAR